jgi:hypothetical protein
MAVVTATVAGETANAEYGVSAKTPRPALPEVTWESLNPQPGESIHTVFSRMTTNAVVVFPAGDFSFGGNDHSGYSVLSKKVQGARGTLGADGKKLTRWVQVPNSFKTGPMPPANAGTAVRLGINELQSGPQTPTLVADLVIVGAEQSLNGALLNRAGLIVYGGEKPMLDNVDFLGVSRGSGNNPATGETISVNLLRANNVTVRGILSDGRDLATGKRVAGSAISINACTNVVVENSTFQYSLVSGVTNSSAGSGAIYANSSRDITYRNNVIAHNANVVMASGQRFSGINGENWLGDNLIEGNTITVDWGEWNAAHFTVASNITEGAQATFTYRNNTVNDVGYQGRNKGALVINLPWNYAGVPNTIQPANLTVIENGVTKTARLLQSTPPAGWNIDPTREYILLREGAKPTT